MAFLRCALKPGRERSVRNRHPWVFSGALARVEGEDGALVDLVDARGRFLARGVLNRRSQIAVRLLTWADEPCDAPWLRERLTAAFRRRRAPGVVDPPGDAFRLCYAESDGLPGLIVDRYGPYAVVQLTALAAEVFRPHLADALVAAWEATFGIPPAGIYERSDVAARRLEGLPARTGLLWGEEPPETVPIVEGSLRFHVDLRRGHKTGFYLDQRQNRARLPAFLPPEGEVLNAFAYTGGFGVAAARAGARAVTHLDASAEALRWARRHQAENAPGVPVQLIEGNAFQVLRRLREEGQRYDLVILDPPKFVHRKADLPRGGQGYKDLNRLGMQLVRPGGVLITFSCSGLVDRRLFQMILFEAAAEAGRFVQRLAELGQGPDHPTSLFFPEGAYLKGAVLRVE